MFLKYHNVHYSISIIPFSDLQHTAYCPNNDWLRIPVRAPISMRTGILFYFIFSKPAHYKRKTLPIPPDFSTFSFTHFPSVMSAMESVTKAIFWKFCLALTFCIYEFMVLTSKQRHVWLFSYTLCRHFVPLEELIQH